MNSKHRSIEIESCFAQKDLFMYAGHGPGEKFYKSVFKYNPNDNLNNNPQKTGLAEIKPTVFLFGCQSLAFKQQMIPGY